MLCWNGLWPSANPWQGGGWSQQLPPGLHLLLDASGEDAAPWLPVLAGVMVPGHGHVQCAGLCSRADAAAYQAQVYWHQPRLPLGPREQLVRDWVAETAGCWPQWDATVWQQHCEGLDLLPHLDKPLWHLSTGSLRKLGLAAALASNARLTVIEEPIAALDRRSIVYLCQALDAVRAERTATQRWVLVAHWEALPGVQWDAVLPLPAASA